MLLVETALRENKALRRKMKANKSNQWHHIVFSRHENVFEMLFGRRTSLDVHIVTCFCARMACLRRRRGRHKIVCPGTNYTAKCRPVKNCVDLPHRRSAAATAQHNKTSRTAFRIHPAGY
jgi:hypothetical protein